MTDGHGNVDRLVASGGAGVGGHGGEISMSYSQGTTDSTWHLSSGGSATAGGASGYGTTFTSVGAADTSGAPTTSPTISVIDAQGYGSGFRWYYNGANGNGGGGFGGGSGAFANNGSQMWARVGDAGGFAGGGALYTISGGDYTGTGPIKNGGGGVGGGGSGAMRTRHFSSQTGATGRDWMGGGTGLCIIMYI